MEVTAKGKYHSKQLYIFTMTTRLFTMLIGKTEMETIGLNGLYFDCYAEKLGRVLKFDLDQIFSTDPRPDEPKKSTPIFSFQWSLKVRAIITKAETQQVLFDSCGESAGVIKEVWGITQTRQNICSVILGDDDGVMNNHLANWRRPDQKLTLEAEVEIIVKINDDQRTLRMTNNNSSEVGLGLLALLTKDHSDVTIKCESEEFKAHRVVLKCYSPVFARMLESPMDESVSSMIHVDDFQPETIQDMINFMYEGTLKTSSKDSIVALLDCAEKYDISELKVAVVKKMLSMIAPDNAAEFAAAVIKFRGDEESKRKIFDYCKANFSKLSTNSHFRQFYVENVKNFM